MSKKITECPTCKKAGCWEWTSDLPKNKIRHKYCGTVFTMSEWMMMKTRWGRNGDYPEYWNEEERQKFFVDTKNEGVAKG